MMDELSYADFFRAHWLYAVRYILYKFPVLGWHDAEDVAQDALLAAWGQRESYDPARATRATWLLTIAYWHGLTAFNRYKQAAPKALAESDNDGLELGDVGETAPDPYDTVARREQLGRVVHFIESLENGELMGALYTRILEGDSVGEAAQTQDVSYAEATWRLQQTRAMLRQEIEATPWVV